MNPVAKLLAPLIAGRMTPERFRWHPPLLGELIGLELSGSYR